MAEVVNMSLMTDNTKSITDPKKIQKDVSDLVKQFSLLINAISTPGLTGASLKALQEHQSSQKESEITKESDVSLK
jgi:hypothetical protein